MLQCHEFKEGDILACDCGLEFKVIKVCESCAEDAESCGCEDECKFICCGEEMVKK